ncbi:MAG: hypothetical protein M3485_04310 [Pseudomonadota bacterium]|nr:hypothetical protein [Pseudomonadota bacterium]
MRTLDNVSDKTLELVSQLSDSLKHAIPDGAGKWLQTGAALTMAKTGSRVAGTFIRRNPAVAVAAAAGAGLLWYVARRQQKKAQNGAIEGKATRIEAKRGTAAPRKRRTAKRSTKAST